MNTKEFERVITEQINTCTRMLTSKAEEYVVGEDRHHNFNVASSICGCSKVEALAGMMVKHTVSIYDMCMDGKDHPIDLWEEKITDHINYLLILRTIIEDGNF